MAFTRSVDALGATPSPVSPRRLPNQNRLVLNARGGGAGVTGLGLKKTWSHSSVIAPSAQVTVTRSTGNGDATGSGRTLTPAGAGPAVHVVPSGLVEKPKFAAVIVVVAGRLAT